MDKLSRLMKSQLTQDHGLFMLK